MFYLDDLAVWVRTQKGSIVRSLICVLLVGIAGFTVWRGFQEKDVLSVAIEENATVLAQDTYDLNRLTEEAKKYERDISYNLFTPTDDGGDSIAYLQSKFGGFDDSATEAIPEKSDLVRNGNPDMTQGPEKYGLVKYTAGADLNNPWYDNPYLSYTWSCISKQSIVVDGDDGKIPAVFVCRFGYPGTDIGVAVGRFQYATGLLEGVDTYVTYAGSKLLDVTHEGSETAVYSKYGDILLYDNFESEYEWRARNEGEDFETADPDETETETEGSTGSGETEGDGSSETPAETETFGEGETETSGETGDGGESSEEGETSEGTSQGADDGDKETGGFDLDKILEGLKS